jgi:hypothetical protein
VDVDGAGRLIERTTTMTPSQLATLAAHIRASTDPAVVTALASGQDNVLATLYNLPAVGVQAWNKAAPVDSILDAIDTTKYTPTATITGSEVEPLLTRKRGWLDEINVKLMVLQTMLVGRAVVDATRATVRASLRDSVIQIPSGALDGNGKPGLTAAAGVSGVNVLQACQRAATVAEDALKSGIATTGSTTGVLLTFDGQVSSTDIADALRPPQV